MRTKSDFRALRETVGMTQATLAHILDVNIRSVKRWENPDNEWLPPDDAWDVLDDARERQRWQVSAALDKVAQIEDAQGDAPREVTLTYWWGAEDFEHAHPGEGWGWQMANATSRLIAARLEDMGYTVGFGWGGLAVVRDAENATLPELPDDFGKPAD